MALRLSLAHGAGDVRWFDKLTREEKRDVMAADLCSRPKPAPTAPKIPRAMAEARARAEAARAGGRANG